MPPAVGVRLSTGVTGAGPEGRDGRLSLCTMPAPPPEGCPSTSAPGPRAGATPGEDFALPPPPSPSSAHTGHDPSLPHPPPRAPSAASGPCERRGCQARSQGRALRRLPRQPTGQSHTHGKRCSGTWLLPAEPCPMSLGRPWPPASFCVLSSRDRQLLLATCGD